MRRPPVPPSGSTSPFDGDRGGSPIRPGAATLDYILVLGVVLPLAAIVIPYCIRIARSVFAFFSTWVSWPFL